MTDVSSALSSSFSQRYNILSSIGRGSMGEVFLAHDNVLGHEVALKLIHESLSANPRVRQCFNREARAFSFIHHPNIVDIYDFGTTESDQIYLSTEHIQGLSLHELQNSHLPLSVIVDIITQILDALSLAHAKGLVHCDIKAENVLIFTQGNKLIAKLADFGLAALPVSADNTQNIDVPIGTPGYMAPEQILHQSQLIGPHTDVYSVGILLYESLSGHLPYACESSTDTLQAHLNSPIPDIQWQPHLANIPDKIKENLNEIVKTALAKKTYQRYISVIHFKQALLDIPIKQEPVPMDEPKIQALSLDSSHEPASTPEKANISAKIRAVEARDDSNFLLASQSLSFAARRLIFQDDDEPYQGPSHLSEVLPDPGLASKIQLKAEIEEQTEFPANERIEEFKLLDKYARLLSHGKGSFCLLTGRFGSGKTRLLRIFSEHLIKKNLCVFTVNCSTPIVQTKTIHLKSASDYSHLFTFNLVEQLLAQTYIDEQKKFSLTDSLKRENLLTPNDEKTIEKLHNYYASMSTTSERKKLENDFWPGTLILLSKLIQEAACISPVCLILDDVQRCDASIWKLLMHLRAVTQKLPLLCIAGYDPTELSGSVNKIAAHQKEEFSPLFEQTIHLGPLSEPMIVDMLKTGWHIDESLGKRIAALSYGNPYYAVARVQHLGQIARLQKNRNGLFSLPPEDERPLTIPMVVIQFFKRKLDDIANIIGSESDLYEEILTRISVFGPEIQMVAMEAFWDLDEDKALSDCWREAIATWCEQGILTMVHDAHSISHIQFIEPWHVDILQSMLKPKKRAILNHQAALALIECYPSPTIHQAWQIASLMKKANEISSYLQYFQQTMDYIWRDAQFKFGEECVRDLVHVLQSQPSPFPQEILFAIDWTHTLIHCAEVCITLDAFETLESLNRFIPKLTKDSTIGQAVAPYIQALMHLRRGNTQRALEMSEQAYLAFLPVSETDAGRALMLQAKCCLAVGNMTEATQCLQKAGSIFTAHEDHYSTAILEGICSRLDWYSGSVKSAIRRSQSCLNQIKQMRYKPDMAHFQFGLLMMDYMSSLSERFIAEMFAEIEKIKSYGDEKDLAEKRVFYFIAQSLANQWQDIDIFAEQYSATEQIGPYDAMVSGTINCLKAIRLAMNGDINKARNNIAMSIPFFGPKNRRALAWCHTLLGAISLFTKEFDEGFQSFERAQKDFQQIDDRFGMLCVEIALSALTTACHQMSSAWPKSLDTLHHASQSQWPILSTLARIVFIQTALETQQPAHVFEELRDDTQAIMPELLRPYAIDILAEAIAQYHEAPANDTQYLFQLYEAISPDACLDPFDSNYPAIDIF